MIKVILIDDEPLARMIVKEYLETRPEVTVVQECGDGFEGVKAIAQHQPDLIFLDVQMPKITGFEMLELLEQPPSVIFTTAFDEYAMKAFEAHAVDYLLKPFSKERFDAALNKWLENRPGKEAIAQSTQKLVDDMSLQPEEHTRVVVKTGSNIRIIPIHEVLYFEAYDDYVKIHTKDGYHLKKKTMSHFEKVLSVSQFIRVHRSYIVQLQEVTRIEPYDKDGHVVLLKSGARIPVSRTGYTRLKEVLGI
jgi:two-component system LytT family response regulator